MPARERKAPPNCMAIVELNSLKLFIKSANQSSRMRVPSEIFGHYPASSVRVKLAERRVSKLTTDKCPPSLTVQF